MNEGWASYWHEKLFLQDDRIEGHEVDFARTHAFVTSLPRVGMNPYALGMRIFHYIEELADKGKYSIEFRRLLDAREREKFDAKTGTGKAFVYKVRENLNDFMFLNTFVDQDFINRTKLFVAGKRLNQNKGVWEYYVKSRKAKDYRQMLFNSLYHPPHISIDPEKSKNGDLYLYHHFEGKPLVKEFIANTMMGIEYLWGAPVKLETSEVEKVESSQTNIPIPGLAKPAEDDASRMEIKWLRTLYTMKDRKLSRVTLANSDVHKPAAN
jgi:stage V sporulation protein R